MAAVGGNAFAAAFAAGEGEGDHASGSVASWIGLHTYPALAGMCHHHHMTVLAYVCMALSARRCPHHAGWG
jgi:hypothetical protein